PLFTVGPAREGVVEGPAAHPRAVGGEPVTAWLRSRRDVPGALVALRDGRYALTGPLIVTGGREDVVRWARRRMGGADPDERVWLKNVVAALAADVPERYT